MNYRHVYHAGNRADVVKHAVLTLLLQALRQKTTPFMVLDTHAGVGRYDLTDAAAQKTQEAAQGIGRFVQADMIEGLSSYYEALAALNPGDLRHGITVYPGSPFLIAHHLREQDRLVACELHPDDCGDLRRFFARNSNVQIHHRDGYEAMRALLPPPEKRGLVFIDPPFEAEGEFALMADTVRTVHQRWPTGLYVLWYPIKNRPQIWQFHEQMAASGIKKQMVAEFLWYDESRSDRFNGSGLLLINPPWQLDLQLKALWPHLHQALESPQPGGSIDWLVSESMSSL